MPEFIFRTTDMGNFDLNRLLDKLCRAQRRMEMNTDGLLVQTSTPAYTPEVPYYAGRVIQPDKQVDDPLDQMVNSGPGDLVSGNAFAIDTTSGEVIKAHAVRGSHQLALGICESSCAPGGMFTYKSSGATWCLVTPGLTTPPTKGKPMYRIYSEKQSKLENAIKLLETLNPLEIGKKMGEQMLKKRIGRITVPSREFILDR